MEAVKIRIFTPVKLIFEIYLSATLRTENLSLDVVLFCFSILFSRKTVVEYAFFLLLQSNIPRLRYAPRTKTQHNLKKK